jgi:anti-sigma B factor antagonist
MDMEITVKQANKVTLVITCGFIDGKTAPAFQTKMLEVLCEADIVLLDLSQVSYMSSAGLRAMLITHKQTQQGPSKTVALAALPDGIRDNMEVTGFLPFFQVFETVEDGLQRLG